MKIIKKLTYWLLSLLTRIQLLVFKLEFRNENRIFTHLTIHEKYILNKYARKIKNKGVCVEIGSYLGSSTCFIASGLNRISKIYCIDTWENDSMIYEEVDNKDNHLIKRDTYTEFRLNTNKFRNKIVEVRGWSFDVVSKISSIEEKINFLFIDGDHSYEGVKKDWDLYFPLLRSGSYVAFHDTGWAEGVIQIVNEAVKGKAILVEKLPNLEVYKMD